ncbi:hypothetical protein ABZ678_25955 [Streptomyces hirsutus]|uniref:hypothetical protein n=1 Tax=Streptomyces hirsutus TaxID=35620 RepID=UPI0033CF9135
MELVRPSIAYAREAESRPAGPPAGVTMAVYRPLTAGETAPVIRDHHRLKGGAAQIGATGPGPCGV